MFFRRRKPTVTSLDERLARLQQQRCRVSREQGDRATIRRDGCGAAIEQQPDGSVKILRAGVLVNGEISVLVDAGYQKWLETPQGELEAATALQLKALHGLLEDVREECGLTSRYNESLGTVNDSHAYDRVSGRGSRTSASKSH